MRGRVETPLRDVEMGMVRNPRIKAATRARNALFAPFILSSNGALGARANAFLKRVFLFVKKGAAWHVQFLSSSGVFLVYYLVLHFLAAADLHGCYGDESLLCRQGPSGLSGCCFRGPEVPPAPFPLPTALLLLLPEPRASRYATQEPIPRAQER